MPQYYQNGEFKIVYVVLEYSYGLHKEYIVGEFDNVEDALKAKTSSSKIEVELRKVEGYWYGN